MIKCEKEKGIVELGGGSEIDISIELILIVRTMNNFLTKECGYSKEEAHDKIERFCKIGLMTEEEVGKEAEAAKQKIANGIAEFAMEILFGGKTE